MKLSYAIIRGIALAAIAIAVAHLSSCTPKAVAVPPLIHQAATPHNQSASPTIANAQQVAGQADVQAAISATQLAKAREAVSTAQGKAKAALAEAERLRKQKTATEAELTQQSAAVLELTNILDTMSADLTQTAASLVKEKDLRVEVSAMLAHAQNLVRLKDAESDELRLKLNHATEQAAAYYQAADQNAKAAMTAQGQIESAKGSTKTWRNIALAMLALFILSLAAHVIRLYLRV